jgi:ABC-2 type transport system permease protein
MNGDEPNIPQSFSLMRRWGAALNLVITVGAVVALVAMLNYLAIRHFTRFHWNRNIEGELSTRTLTVLRSLTNTVKIVVYFDSEDPLFSRVKGLLKEYELATPRVQVQHVDYLRDNAAARKVQQDYPLASVKDKNIVIFDVKDRPAVVVSDAELSDYDTTDLVSGKSKEVYRTHFKGELLFTSKIFAVANARSPAAYYLLGHGEHLPEHYGKFISLLRDENNFDVQALWLSGTNEVPATCNLLIVAGPTQPLDRTEVEKIRHYLEQGGRMLLAFNSATVNRRPTGLERLLALWGVDVGDNWVVDPQNSRSGGMLDVIPVDLGRHPLVNALQKSANSRVQLYRPRSISAIRPASRGNETKVDELLFTGPNTVVYTDLSSRETDPTQKGSKPLMVAVEKSVQGLQRGSMRLVVVGDSTLWDNDFIDSSANADLAALAANWLVSQAVLLSDIPRRPIQTYKLTMTRAQLRTVQLAFLVGMPGAVLLAGSLVWLRRRH